MKTIIVLAALVAATVLFGWLDFTSDSSGVSARFDTQKAEQDVERAAEKTSDAIESAAEKTSDAIEESGEDSDVEKPEERVAD